jgi:glycosyltransferase involved in cell wall biosynthesis
MGFTLMKIGFLGNTNNYPFTLARAFRSLGHEVVFLVNQKYELHRPESQFPELKNAYPDWIVDCSDMDETDYALPTPLRARFVSVLRDCDAVVLNHLGPSLADLIEKPSIALLTGSDLTYSANPSTLDIHRNSSNSNSLGMAYFQWESLIPRQRAGITTAKAVYYLPKGIDPEGDTLLDGLNLSKEQRIFFLMKEPKAYLPILKEEGPIRVLCGARLTWKKPRYPGSSLLDYKGTDIMIRGLGQYYRKSGHRLDIRLVRKGRHIQETLQLVHEEGLTQQVTWCNELTQTEFLNEVCKADIVFDQLDTSMPAMAALDAMAAEKPVIAHARPDILEPLYGAWPICQAQTPEEVCEHLNRLAFNPEERSRIGKASRTFVEKHFLPEHAVNLCLEKLK